MGEKEEVHMAHIVSSIPHRSVVVIKKLHNQCLNRSKAIKPNLLDPGNFVVRLRGGD